MAAPTMQYNVLISHLSIGITEEDGHKMSGCLESSHLIPIWPEATTK